MGRRIGWSRVASLASVALLGLAVVQVPPASANPLAHESWISKGWTQDPHSVGSSLRPGMQLKSGESIDDPKAPTQVVMEPNGNLVLFYVPLRQEDPYRAHLTQRSLSCSSVTCALNRPQKLWASRTAGHPGASAEVTNQGILEVVSNGRVIWKARSTSHPGASLSFTSRGDLQLVRPQQQTDIAETGRGRPQVVLVSAVAHEISDTPVPNWVAGSTVPQYVGQSLASGQTLGPGQYLESQNGLYSYYMTPGGIVSEFLVGAACPQFAFPQPIDWFNLGPVGVNNWLNHKSTPPGPFPVAGASVTMTTGGSLVLSVTSAATNVTLAYGPPGSSLSIDDSGGLAFVSASGSQDWSPPVANTMCPGQTLYPGTQIPGAGNQGRTPSQYDSYLGFANRSPKGYELDTVLQQSGANHVWSDSSAPSSVYAIMQFDGNFVIYPQGQADDAYWSTETNGDNGAFVAVSSNAIFAVVTATVANGVATWTLRYTSPNKITGETKPTQITLTIGTYT